MPNIALYGPDAINGRSKWNIVDHTGPASYVVGGETLSQGPYGGPNIFGLANFQGVIVVGITVSGNYVCEVNYGGLGARASVKMKWVYANAQQGVDGLSGTGGSGMTAGTYAVSFAGGGGGSGAAANVTVSTSAITAIQIVSGGSGYISVPTASIASGGTPPSLTAYLGSVDSMEVPAGTVLTGETIRLIVIGG